MLNESARKLIEEHRVGFVASVNADGTPNLSPKGTMIVLDDNRIACADIRSPRTVKNLRARPAVEVNFLDIFARKGVRIRGAAQYVEKGDLSFEKLIPLFSSIWPELIELTRGLIIIEIKAVRMEHSPVYDLGLEEEQLRQRYKDYYEDL